MISILYQPLQRRREGTTDIWTPTTTLIFRAMYTRSRAARRCCLVSRIPIAALAILLAIVLPDLYTSSALVEIDEPSSAQSLAETSGGESYADQYVQNLKGIVLTDSNLRKMAKEDDLYPGYDDDERHAQARQTRHQRQHRDDADPRSAHRTRTRSRRCLHAVVRSSRSREGAEGRAMAGQCIPRRAPPTASGACVECGRVLRQGGGAHPHACRRARIEARRLQASQCRSAARADRSQHVDHGSHREPARSGQPADELAAAGTRVPRCPARTVPRRGSGCGQRPPARGPVQPHAFDLR